MPDTGGTVKVVPSDLEIAKAAVLKPIGEIAAKLGVPEAAIEPYGWTKAKLSYDFLAGLGDRPKGRLILVTGINPTPAGEGKTTTTVGLGDALARLGKKVAICLREPSLGPCFGVKGGAAGGGYAQVVPMADINLHFTGDFHAITAAHNLLSAMIDNHLQWGNALGLDPRRITWRRVIDANDRALRNMVIGLGGPANGVPREDGFDITPASEVMAILCLSSSLADLKERLGRIVIGQTRDKKPVHARDLNAHGAMAVLLRDALKPNLVQTLEHTPAIIHGGPFANIAHGCNSLMATRTALSLADYVVTEAGFGADLGAEKFFDIKCRQGGLTPDLAVIVATIRALKMHGGVEQKDLKQENLAALEKGLANLGRHVANLRKFGLPVVVAVNRFSSDTAAEMRLVTEAGQRFNAEVVEADHWAQGGAGAEDLARTALGAIERRAGRFAHLYPDAVSLWTKIETVAKEIYGASGCEANHGVRARLDEFEAAGYGNLPVCIAKTQYSFSSDPRRRGAPTGHTLPVREVRLSAGAGFVVAICCDINTMPGLPRIPSAEAITLNDQGEIEGLF